MVSGIILSKQIGSLIRVEGVGKSTIVTSLIKESYVAHVCDTNLSDRAVFKNSACVGPAYCARSHYTSRSNARKCNNLHR